MEKSLKQFPSYFKKEIYLKEENKSLTFRQTGAEENSISQFVNYAKTQSCHSSPLKNYDCLIKYFFVKFEMALFRDYQKCIIFHISYFIKILGYPGFASGQVKI